LTDAEKELMMDRFTTFARNRLGTSEVMEHP